MERHWCPSLLAVKSIFAILGLAFYVYAISRILRTWQYRDWANKTAWFIILGAVGGTCLVLLFSELR
jgi:hypothetical protein